LTITPDFVLKESLHLQNRTDQLMTGKLFFENYIEIIIKINKIFSFQYHIIQEKVCFYYWIQMVLQHGSGGILQINV